jgi:DNA-binding protein HU-beta
MSKKNWKTVIKELSKKTGKTKKETKDQVEALLEYVVENVEEGNEVLLLGFGKFSMRKIKARVAHNPQTGGKVEAPEINTPHFKAGKSFKDRLKNK